MPIFTIGEPTDEAYCLPYAQFLLAPLDPQGTGGAFCCRLPWRPLTYAPSTTLTARVNIEPHPVGVLPTVLAQVNCVSTITLAKQIGR